MKYIVKVLKISVISIFIISTSGLVFAAAGATDSKLGVQNCADAKSEADIKKCCERHAADVTASSTTGTSTTPAAEPDTTVVR